MSLQIFNPPGKGPVMVFRSAGKTVDNSARLQSALNQLAAASQTSSYYVPEFIFDGLCGIASGVSIAPGYESAFHMRGANPLSGIIGIAGSEGSSLLRISSATAPTYYSLYSTIQNMQVSTAVEKTGGYAIEINTGWRVKVHKVVMQAYNSTHLYHGIKLGDGSCICNIERCQIYDFKRHGIHVTMTGKNYVSTGLGYGTTPQVHHNDLFGADTTSIGYMGEGGDGHNLSFNGFVRCGTAGMILRAPSEPSPQLGASWCYGNVFSDLGGDGILIDGTNYSVGDWNFTDNYIGTNLGRGLKIIGSHTTGITYRGGEIGANNLGGVFIGAGTKDVVIESVKIANNGTTGIEVESGATDWAIMGNRIADSLGTGALGSGYDQTYGVKFNGSHNNYRFVNNDLRGNITSGTTGTPGGSNKIDTPNLT